MADAKNSIMDRIRKVIALAKADSSSTGSFSSEELVPAALLKVVSHGRRRCDTLPDFLFDRLAYDMAHTSTFLTTEHPPRFVAAIQEIFDHAPASVSTIFARCVLEISRSTIARSYDPATMQGCIYHAHRTSQDQKECEASWQQENLTIAPDQGFVRFTPHSISSTPRFGQMPVGIVDRLTPGLNQNSMPNQRLNADFSGVLSPQAALQFVPASSQPQHQHNSSAAFTQTNMTTHALAERASGPIIGFIPLADTTSTRSTSTSNDRAGYTTGFNASGAYFTWRDSSNSQ